MKPLYLLKTGKPGSSFAFEIARQIGFPVEVLDAAAGKTSGQLDFDRELQNLETEKVLMSQKSTELNVADEFLNEMITKYKKLNEELEESKKEIIRKAKEEALQLLIDSNRLIEKTIKDIKENQAEKTKTKESRQEIQDLKQKIEKDNPIESQPVKKKLVTINTQSTGSTPFRGPFQSFYDDLQNKLAQFQLTLDLRGKRADETYSLLQHYIDDAILLNIHEVRILHGKGNGVLRQITREYLAGIKEVKKFSDESLEHGGSGITLVNFR